jgi:hypothetical protein
MYRLKNNFFMVKHLLHGYLNNEKILKRIIKDKVN